MQSSLYIGADVAKDTLVVACAAHTFTSQTLTNRAPALKAWLKTLPAGSVLGLEATGGYHTHSAGAVICRWPSTSTLAGSTP